MGTLAAFLLVTAALSSPAEEAPPSHQAIMAHGVRLVDAPATDDDEEELTPPGHDPRTAADVEINCPPPTRLRCWMATDQDAGGPTVYCKCSR